MKNIAYKKETEIKLSNRGQGFEGGFEVPSDDKYEFYIRVDGNGFYRESKMFFINAENRVPEIKSRPGNMFIMFNNKKTISLIGLFQDPKNDSLSFETAVDNPDCVNIRIMGDNIEILPKKGGSTVLTITAVDGKGGTQKINVYIRVLPVYIAISVCAITGVIILFIVIRVIISSNRKKKRRKKRNRF
jgi:hypothetical protein